MQLPIFCCGRRYTQSDRDSASIDTITLKQRTGLDLEIPPIDKGFIKRSIEASTDLSDTPLCSIVNFLSNVGKNWKMVDYPRRKIYVNHLCRYLGYSRAMAENEANWIALLLCASNRIYDSLACELGDWNMVDRWVCREEVNLKALPLGTLLHLLPGNVPLSAVISMIRAAVTKNRSIIKLSADDPFTSSAILQSFIEVDAKHPVTTSFSIGYWPRSDSEVGPQFAKHVDGIIAWGGNDLLAWCQKHARESTDIIKFGPKRSLTIIGECDDFEEAAKRVAFDASIYDQRACFSTRQVFVMDSIYNDFKEKLAKAMTLVSELIPKGQATLDELADQALTLQQNRFLTPELLFSDAWSIVDIDSRLAEPHCLGRTIYLQKIAQPEAVYPYIDKSVQTVGIYPHGLGERLRDELARRGVSRIVEVGSHNVFRLGGSHDGLLPMQRLVRFVSQEAPSSQIIKGMPAEIDQVLILENDEFLDFIP